MYKRQPWALAKDEANKARLESVLYHLCEALRVAGILLNAYLPSTAPKMMDQLGPVSYTHLIWEFYSSIFTDYNIKLLFHCTLLRSHKVPCIQCLYSRNNAIRPFLLQNNAHFQSYCYICLLYTSRCV